MREFLTTREHAIDIVLVQARNAEYSESRRQKGVEAYGCVKAYGFSHG
jgi:hypothetical protein